MQTFTIGLGRGWWVRLWAATHWCAAVTGLRSWCSAWRSLTVVTTPVAGTIGTSVHDAHARVYAEEAHHRHRVIATAIEDGTVVMHPNTVLFTARATWSAAGHDHTDIVTWADQARVGEQRDIWVNAQGAKVGPPSSSSDAAADAVGLAINVWLGVAAASAGLVYVVRRGLDHRRYAQWDRELNASRENDGRTNHQ